MLNKNYTLLDLFFWFLVGMGWGIIISIAVIGG